MLSSIKPIVLFTHGFCHSPVHFSVARALFEEAGFTTACPALPSVGALPPTGFLDDAQRIRAELEKLVTHEAKAVVVVAHSYGGAVVSQAADALFSREVRQSHGKSGGIVAIIYVAAALPLPGQSVSALFGFPDSPPTFLNIDETGRAVMPDPERHFYNDLPPEDQVRWAAELKPQPVVSITTTLTFAAYMHHPTWYIHCEEDQMVPMELQREILQAIMDTTGVDMKTESIGSGHSPFLSQPDVLLERVKRIVLLSQ